MHVEPLVVGHEAVLPWVTGWGEPQDRADSEHVGAMTIDKGVKT